MRKLINPYMHDIGNLRSHHWKYWMDVYENCAYDCQYCVYRSGDRMGKISALVDDSGSVVESITSLSGTGIVYLGPKADVYQHVERRLGKTRMVLEMFAERRIPTFIVTRAELMTRDIDIFKEMARHGLIELSITIASAKNQERLEPNTPSVAARLEMVAELRRCGIPVSVHMSPIIPFLDSVEEMTDLMERAVASGAQCIYACMLGMSDRYYDVVKRALGSSDATIRLEKIYKHGNRRSDIYSAEQTYIDEYMSQLSKYASQHAIPFSCVHIPEYDTVERTGHIFRHKLPNVGDIVRYFHRTGTKEITLTSLQNFVAGFSAVDDNYINKIREFWNEDVLFKNTYFWRDESGDTVKYTAREGLDLLVTNMKVEAA